MLIIEVEFLDDIDDDVDDDDDVDEKNDEAHDINNVTVVGFEDFPSEGTNGSQTTASGLRVPFTGVGGECRVTNTGTVRRSPANMRVTMKVGEVELAEC